MRTFCHTFAKLAQKHEKYLYTVLILSKIFCISCIFSLSNNLKRYFTYLFCGVIAQFVSPTDFLHH